MSNTTNNAPSKDDISLRLKEMDWRARYDRFIHCDRAAVDIGIAALKTAILVNAGAIVSLLALIGQLWNNQEQGRELAIQVISECNNFIYGIISGGVAFAIAYFYQSTVTEIARRDLEDVFGKSIRSPAVLRTAKATGISMIALTVISLIFFFAGVLKISCILKLQ